MIGFAKQLQESMMREKYILKELTAEELNSTETPWIKWLQTVSLPEEIKFLNGKNINLQSPHV